jgi:uncharacterized protein (UPF0261 family)
MTGRYVEFCPGGDMRQGLKILVVGTADTKADELLFIKACIERQGGSGQIMDVGVLGTPAFTPEVSNHEVAAAAHSTLARVAELGDENEAMKVMAAGAVSLAVSRYRRGEVDGLLALGGTMGTDLALDVTAALPVGMPKLIVTTVAHSHLIPPDRLAPDLMTILWAGGLFGLNSICRSILSQAAGAILGACGAVERPSPDRPAVAIGGLGKSCLSYMVDLKPALEKRGFEAVVFHCTGMGGRAMEALIDQGAFAAVFDFALCELGNYRHGSVVNAGPTRLEAAGRRGVPQLVSPGASDMIDVQAWAPLPERYEGRPYHAHNRLIGSTIMTADERRDVARYISGKVNQSQGPVAFLLPRRGIHAWDVEGQPLHDAPAHAAYCDEFSRSLEPPVELHDLDLHINDPAFVDRALLIFDRWVDEGLISRRGAASAERSP